MAFGGGIEKVCWPDEYVYTTQPATAKQRVIESGWLQPEEIEIL